MSSRKRPGMVLPDGRNCTELLTIEEYRELDRIDRLLRRRRREGWRVVSQERVDLAPFDREDRSTWRPAVVALYPKTVISNGETTVTGRWLIDEYPDEKEST